MLAMVDCTGLNPLAIYESTPAPHSEHWTDKSPPEGIQRDDLAGRFRYS